jgi:hypothetical protein
MGLEIGSQLGHYDVTALIGEGGMGQVYRARDTKSPDIGIEVNRHLRVRGGVMRKPTVWLLSLILAGLATSRAPAQETAYSSAIPKPLFRIVEQGKWGLIDETGQVLVPPKYDDLGHLSGRALVGRVPRVVSDALRLLRAGPVRHDLVRARLGKKWGFVGHGGDIAPRFDDAGTFGTDGLAQVKVGGRWGYIDRTGRIVIDPQFNYAEEFACGVAMVSTGRWPKEQGLIDVEGRFIVEPTLEGVSDPCAGPLTSPEDPPLDPVTHARTPIGVEKDGKQGFVNRTGSFVIAAELILPGLGGAFAEGLTVVRNDGKSGYIDETGKVVISPRFDAAYAFVNGLAQVRLGEKEGYIEKSGTLVIPARFDRTFPFRSALARVQVDDSWAYIDRAGAPVVENLEYAGAFAEGLAPVRVNGRVGYIDETGRMVITPRFESAGAFQDDRAVVQVGATHGYIDRAGELVIEPRWDRAGRFSAGLALVMEGDLLHYIDTDGDLVYTMEFLELADKLRDSVEQVGGVTIIR